MSEERSKFWTESTFAWENMFELKQDFFAVLSRELREPLEYVGQELEGGELDEDQRCRLGQAVRYMTKVLQNITEYEMLEQGRIRFENKYFELDELLWNVFRTWEKRAETLGIGFVLNIDLERKHHFGDAGRIGQIINSVTGNCVMASEKNSEIRIWGNDINQGGSSQLQLVVEDTGIPVADSFYGRKYPMGEWGANPMWEQGDGEVCTAFSLTVARKMAELMGGSIHLKRRGNKVNVIDVSIPLQRKSSIPENRILEPENGTDETGELKGCTFLLVEGVASKKYDSGSLLRLNGATVYLASDGKEAVELCAGYPPDMFQAVLLEGVPPDMHYPEFALYFRTRGGEDVKEVPVIVLAEEVRQDIIDDSIRLGINAIMDVPLEPKRLKGILDMNADPLWRK